MKETQSMFSINWSQLKDKARALSWYSDIVSTVQARVDASIARGLTVPDLPGGWLHKYVCQETWMPLRYNPTDAKNHTSLLGKVYTGEPFNGGWLVWRHRELADTAREAGILFKLQEEPKYFDAVKTILTNYAERYGGFAGDEDAETWMTKGRAFNQALSEAIWAVPIVQGFGFIQEELDDAERTRIIEQLLYPIAETLSKAHDSLIAQGKVKSNYVAWLIAAIGSIGFVLNDEALIHRSIDGEGGFKKHFDASILEDGFQYEVTPYYHNFVALAFIHLAEAALSQEINLYDYKAPQGQSIASLWEAFAELSYPDGTVVELNDGSYWQESIYDIEICDVYEVALARAPKEAYPWLLQHAYKRRNTGRDSWTALLFAENDLSEVPNIHHQSICLKASGVVVLKDGDSQLAACIPFGDFAGSHSHLDRLGLSIWPFSQDAGTPLYGIEARVSWYQETLAHNTVVVDGKSQDWTGGCLKRFAENSVSLHSDKLYKDISMTRTVSLQGELVDKFTLQSEMSHTYDWLCHTDGKWTVADIAFEALNQPYSDEGAGSFVTLTSKAVVNKSIRAETAYGGQTFSLELSSSQPFELLLATCPGRSQHPHKKRHLLIARIEAKSVEYNAIYKAVS